MHWWIAVRAWRDVNAWCCAWGLNDLFRMSRAAQAIWRLKRPFWTPLLVVEIRPLVALV